MSAFRLAAAIAAGSLYAAMPVALASAAPVRPAPMVAGPTAGDRAAAAERDLRQDSDGAVSIRRDELGVAHLVGTAPGTPVRRPDGVAATASTEAKATAQLSRYAPLFALDKAGSAVHPTRTLRGLKQSVVRFQQSVDGLPVVGGELAVAVDGAGNLRSVTGETSPLPLDAAARTVSAEAAQHTALALVARSARVDAAALRASTAKQWAYDPALLGAPGAAGLVPVWRIEVTGPADVRELVLVDSRNGSVPLHLDLVTDALDRVVCDRNNVRGTDWDCLTDSAVRTEGSTPSGVVDADWAYDNAGYTSGFYQSTLGVDLTTLFASTSNDGTKLRSTVRYCDTADLDPACPMVNAFWNGRGMYYGQGFAEADDVVAHELTHGVTEHTSGLIPAFQPGAINESMSDVMGELVDLTDGSDFGIAQPWQVGEDAPGGALRDMANPTATDQPDRMTSSLYDSDINLFDNGGVHTNLGVGNKAGYLIAEPGTRTFNGQTITGLGYVKAAKIYYGTEQLLTSGSDYQDLYGALPQACKNLAATAGSGIVTADCTTVSKAVTATEMNLQPTVPDAQVPEATVGCSTTKKDLFLDGFEGSLAKWTVSPGQWSLIDYFAKTGKGSLYGLEPDHSASVLATMSSAITVPSGAKTYVRFDHQYMLDYDPTTSPRTYYDGARVEYSASGGPWTNASTLPWSNGPTKTITPDDTTTTYKAFGGDSHGYQSSRVDVSSLAGKSVRFRWRITGDSIIAFDGWTLDNVNVYVCRTTTKISSAASPTSLTYGSTAKVSGKLTRSDTGAALTSKTVNLYAKKTTSKTYGLAYTTTTSSTGAYTFTVKPQVSTSYYADFAGTSAYMPIRGPVITIPVKPKITAAFADSTISRTTTAALSGTVAPNHAGQTVLLQQYYSSAWHTVTSTTLTSTSAYKFSFKKTTAGTYTYRVYKAADTDHATGASATVKLTVS